MKSFVLFVALVVLGSHADAQKTEFSGEQAYGFLKVLAGEIGPRPMGSPAERRALEYAVSKFREFGCDEAYIMPMAVAHGINTNSGIAVGIQKGSTGRIIIIGGHIDSAGPDIPGANDDASGAASVIEFARVLCKRQNESTVMFCCWGGEEEGLRGSEYFANHFSLIDSVALMMQIDMSDGGGDLMIDPDGPFQVSAPRWLTRAAFEEACGSLGYNDVVYTTHASTLKSVGPGGTGSDHEPFLQKGIPSIDFTSDVTYPIHTPLDNLQNFTPSGLVRSGDIVLRLFKRFDGGTPDRTTEKYYLVQIGSNPVFLTYPTLWVLLGFAFLVAVIALFIIRSRHVMLEPGTTIRRSGIKMLVFVFVIQCFVWSSENVVGLLRGVRFPWVNNYSGFVVLGILGGFIGLWLMFRLATRWKITTDPYVLYLRAFVILALYGIAFSLPGPELGVYPAFALFCLGIAMIVRRPSLKFIFAALSPYLMLHLVFPEYLGLFLRGFAAFENDSFLVVASVHGGLIFLFTVFALPFAYGFAAVYRDAGVELIWLERFRYARGFAFTVLIFGLLASYLATRPVYDRLWQRVANVEQRYQLGSDTSSVVVKSTEYLDGIEVNTGRRDTVLHGRVTSFRPESFGSVPWLAVRRHDEPINAANSDDTIVTILRRLSLSSWMRPYIVEVAYHGRSLMDAESHWSKGSRRGGTDTSRETKVFTWYSFPDMHLEVPVKLTWKKGTRVTETIRVTYDTIACPLRASGEFTTSQYRTIVTSSDTIRIAPSNPATRQ